MQAALMCRLVTSDFTDKLSKADAVNKSSQQPVSSAHFLLHFPLNFPIYADEKSEQTSFDTGSLKKALKDARDKFIYFLLAHDQNIFNIYGA